MNIRTGCTAALLLSSAISTLSAQATARIPETLVFPGANSRDTYFNIHNITAAHALARGRGARVGVLDHSFGIDQHPELYAGGEVFQTDRWRESYRAESHHGYWMALTVREIAPEAEIYALGTYSSDEALRVDAMIRALDWSVSHRLDVVTYSAMPFSPEARRRLDEAVARTVAAGVVVAFIHYPHPDNLLPTGLFPSGRDEGREADLNIYHYDYKVVFPARYDALTRGDTAQSRGYVPFLSISSTSPVVAGMVALLRGLDPGLTPADIRRVLRESSHPLTFKGQRALRVPDALVAVRRVRRK